MKLTSSTWKNRRAWTLDNDCLTLTILQGGGHLAGLTHRDAPGVNPYWQPPWDVIEPWQYRAARSGVYESRLLASICGHSVCLGWFGDASEEERRCGLGPHGEAPVVRWRCRKRVCRGSLVALTVGCELPGAGMRLVRTISTRRGSGVIRVRERVENLLRRDLPFTMCQHVTLGPPFLDKGATVFDMTATRCHTFPGHFEDRPRLQADRAFRWPDGPGIKGESVDMRRIARRYRVSSDFSTQLMDPRREDAWFSALNPNLGLLVAYIWKRSDYPWLGNWEENYGRKAAPWSGKTLARGMEFANTPFPTGLRDAVARGRFQGRPTFRWLPARGRAEIEYHILALQVHPESQGVADIRRTRGGFDADVIL